MSDGRLSRGRRAGVRVVTIAAAAGLIVAACGSDDGDGAALEEPATIAPVTTAPDPNADEAEVEPEPEPAEEPGEAGPIDTLGEVDDSGGWFAFDEPAYYLGDTTSVYDVEAVRSYFDRTVVVAERDAAGQRVEFRRSTVPYGELFDLAWEMPSGSADECFGRDAIFVGDPDVEPGDIPVGDWAPWYVRQLPAVDEREGPVVLTPWLGFEASTFLVITDGADEVELRVDGVSVDRQPVADGAGLLVTEHALVYESGAVTEIALFSTGVETGVIDPWAGWQGQHPEPCRSPTPPRPSLPEPGEQPVDPVAAEQEVRAVHDALVAPPEGTQADLALLLDDDRGVAEAVEAMRAGSFADSAAAATYEIFDVVFSTPTDAWFDYEITAPTGTFGDRFGRSVFMDGSWRITRATICQDLALASGVCEGEAGTPAPVLPNAPTQQELDEWFDDNLRLVQEWGETLECNPLVPCWSPRLPEPGEQPVDADSAADEIESALVALVDLGTPLADELDLVDDPTGLAEAAAEFAERGAVDAVRADVFEIVFTTTTEAWIEFEVFADLGGDFESSIGTRFGRAVLVDGRWLITRGTMCDLLQAGGTQCAVDWSPEVPPR